jgi:hypothetical protein
MTKSIDNHENQNIETFPFLYESTGQVVLLTRLIFGLIILQSQKRSFLLVLDAFMCTQCPVFSQIRFDYNPRHPEIQSGENLHVR